MKHLYRLFLFAAIACTLSAAPMMAQIHHGLRFTTSFPFYVENTYMPAGSYTISPNPMDPSILTIRSQDGSRSAFVDVISGHSNGIHEHSAVTFRKYGNTDFLHRIWVEGQKYRMVIPATHAETAMADQSAYQEHSVPGTPSS